MDATNKMDNAEKNLVTNPSKTMSFTLKMSKGKLDYRSEAKTFFEELVSWKDEAHKQISNIINSHSSNINSGIESLVEENGGLRAELSVLRKERTVLLDTVDNLNGEMKRANVKLQLLQNLMGELNNDTPVKAVLFTGNVEINDADNEQDRTPSRKETDIIDKSDEANQQKLPAIIDDENTNDGI